jgi:hypothetical protein
VDPAGPDPAAAGPAPVASRETLATMVAPAPASTVEVPVVDAPKPKPKPKPARPSPEPAPVAAATIVPAVAAAAPVSAPVEVAPVAASSTLDQQYEQRRGECKGGFIGSNCRKKIRLQLCEGKWADKPEAGMSICQTKNR